MAGAALSRGGLHRRTPLATATLILGANAPDIDILSSFGGTYASLAFRRGWTHGPLAMVLLPFLVAAFILGWDRWVRRRRRPEAPPARRGDVLLLAALGVLSHPILDWLNTYGIRLLMPFDGRWFYGDAVFIIDPWLWLILGGGIFLAGRRTVVGGVAWGGVAALLSVPVLLAPQVPPPARWVWGGWLTLLVVLRLRGEGGSQERPAAVACGAAALYIALMVGASTVARGMGERAASAAGVADIREVLYSPLPANPFAADLVVATGDDYRYGTLRWLPGGGAPRVRLDGPVLPRGDWNHPAVLRALEDPRVRDYLVWSRFPAVRVEAAEVGGAEEVEVVFGDARYPPSRSVGGLGGVRVRVEGGASPTPLGAP